MLTFFYLFIPFFTGTPLPNPLLTFKGFFENKRRKRKCKMGSQESCPSLKEDREDALIEWSKLRAEKTRIMVSNDLISVLFAVLWQRISPATEGVVFIVLSPDAPRRRVVRLLPLFKSLLLFSLLAAVCFPPGSLYSLKLLVHPGLHSHCFTLD